MRLDLWIDPNTECPNERGDWQLHSFNSRHNSFSNPSQYLRLDEDGRPVPANIGFARKLKVGTAFVLSYFEHGSCVWGHRGEVPSCQWDTTKVAGVLVWEQPVKNLGPKSYVDREKDARAYLSEYTDWANGLCFGFTIYDDKSEPIESCGGFIGIETIQQVVAEDYPQLFDDIENKVLKKEVDLTGDASWIMEQTHAKRNPKKSL